MPENPDDMAYILWSEDSVFNFSNYSYAYRQAAEALYEQFKIHKGDYAVKDPMGDNIAQRVPPISLERVPGVALQ